MAFLKALQLQHDARVLDVDAEQSPIISDLKHHEVLLVSLIKLYWS
jgi:hypothetical protein